MADTNYHITSGMLLGLQVCSTKMAI